MTDSNQGKRILKRILLSEPDPIEELQSMQSQSLSESACDTDQSVHAKKPPPMPQPSLPPPQSDDEQTRLSGVEPFVVGLSPTFWAHVPLYICQLQQIQLIHGVVCLVHKPSTCTSQSPKQHQQLQAIALSKCVIVGMIVAVEQRSNGSIIYVLDDGTGLVDCHVWQDSALQRDLLPPLLPFDTTTRGEQDGADDCLQIGQMVRVFGRISIVSIPKTSHNTDNNKRVICEIHVLSMHLLSAPQVTPGSLDSESRHWLETAKSLSNACTVHKVVEELGPSITEQIVNKTDLPCAEDSVGEWRLFGARCTCTVEYKHALLYCHCQASLEASDAAFRYRDALLMCLLEMEMAQLKGPLVFSYREVVEREDLSAIATEQGPSNAHRVAVNTFRKLRQDGILYLMDVEQDTYMLISTKRVLEPYMKKWLYRDLIRDAKKERPAFLARVPRARIELVKRIVVKSRDM